MTVCHPSWQLLVTCHEASLLSFISLNLDDCFQLIFNLFPMCIWLLLYSRFNYVLKRISYLIELWLISILRSLKFKSSFVVVWIVIIFLFCSLIRHSGFCFSLAFLFCFVFLLSMFLISYLCMLKWKNPDTTRSSIKLVS